MITIYATISLVLTIATGLLSFISYHDDMGIEIPYFSIIIKAAPIILIALLFLKANLRWQALSKSRHIQAFKISYEGWKKCLVYELFQVVLFVFMAILLLIYFERGIMLAIVLLFYVIESTSHVFLGKKNYKIILTEKAITIINNNLIIIPWEEIKGIVKRHNSIQFKLSNNTIKVLDRDFIELQERTYFNDQIKNLSIKKNIFIEE